MDPESTNPIIPEETGEPFETAPTPAQAENTPEASAPVGDTAENAPEAPAAEETQSVPSSFETTSSGPSAQAGSGSAYFAITTAANASSAETGRLKKSNGALKTALIVVSIVLALFLLFTGALSALVFGLLGRMPQKTDPATSAPGIAQSEPEKTTPTPVPLSYNEDDWINPGALDDDNAIVNVAAKCSPSIVTVAITTSTGSGSGSGVIWSQDGYIVTNNHVVEDALTITVTLENGASYPASLLDTDPDNDLALIRIHVSGLLPASIGSSADLKIGQTAVVIGNPLGTLANTVTSGIVSALAREITVEGTQMNLMQTTAAINPGNSGGGCFDINGNLIGIVNAKKFATGVEGLGFAIPVDTVKTVIAKMVASDNTSLRKSFGFSAFEITEDNYSEYRQNSVIRRMEELNGSPIYGVCVTAGTQAQYQTEETFASGDMIRTINGNDVRTFADLDAILEKAEVGDLMTITVKRLVVTNTGFFQSRYSLEDVTIVLKVTETYR